MPAETAVRPASRDTVEEFWNDAVVAELLASGAGAAPNRFADQLAEAVGVTGRVSLFATAREALSAYLARMPRDNRRELVLITAFTCAAVAEAVCAAGLTPVTVDAGATFGALDPEAVVRGPTDRVAALVVPHLFGVPAEVRPLVDWCRRHDVRLVEDCSQTVGATLDGVPAGAHGAAAVFSFGYDKPVSLGGGGLLVTRDGTEVDGRTGTIGDDRRQLTELRVFLRRRRHLIVRTGITADPARRRELHARAAEAPPPTPIGPLRASLGLWQLDRYDDVRRRRNANARRLAGHGLTTWPVPSGVEPAWLKQKVLLPDAATADRVSRALQSRGLRAGPFNWAAPVPDGLTGAIRPLAAAYTGRSIDVPIHQRMLPADIDAMAEMLRTAA